MTADTLARALAARATAAPSSVTPPGVTTSSVPPSAAAPVVVPLGTADVLGRGERDPYAERRPRATVHLTAREVLIGPWGGDGDPAPACGRCLAMRWQRLRSKSERDALETGTGAPVPVGVWPLLPDYALDAVWALYEAAVLTPHPDAPRQVSRLDLATLRTDTHRLLPEPLCPHCAPESAPEADPPLALHPRPKPSPDAYRLRPAASLPLDDDALANPVCGALGTGTWLNVTSPTTSPVAGTVFMRGYAGLTDVTWSGQANSYRASRDLAFLEGLERYAGTHRRDPAPPLVEAYSALRDRGVPAVDPVECGTYAPETYRDDPMVSPFDPDRPIPWVEGYSLRDDRTVLVPARLVYYSAGLHADNFVFECSNGCAIGSTLEEAVLFGLLELIERDAFLLGWFGGARLTEIDLASCGVGTVRAMADRAALQGYDIHVFDNRVDLAIPVVTGLAVRRDGGPGALSFGAAASLDPAAAIESALSEVLTYIPHLPRQVSERRAELEAMADDFGKVLHLKDHAQLYGLPRMKEHARGYLEPRAVLPVDEVYADWAHRTDDLLADVRRCRDELAEAGHDVIVVDQTTPEQRRLGLRTVSTLAPGLLPIDFGWPRQRALRLPRLRHAPVRAGWRTTPLEEDDLHRVPHPFP